MHFNLKALCTFYGHVLPSSGHARNYCINVTIRLPGFTCSDCYKLLVAHFSSLNIFVNNKKEWRNNVVIISR